MNLMRRTIKFLSFWGCLFAFGVGMGFSSSASAEPKKDLSTTARLAYCLNGLKYLGINLTFNPRFFQDDKGKVTLEVHDSSVPGSKPIDKIVKWLDSVSGVKIIKEVLELSSQDKRDINPYRKIADAMRMTIHADPKRVEALPKEGPTIYISNHPLYGVGDGVPLGAVLTEARPDLKVMMNRVMGDLPLLDGHTISVDLTGGPNSAINNAAALSRALEHLKNGKSILIFPAGAISRDQEGLDVAADSHWRRGLARMINDTDAAVVPVFVHNEPDAVYRALTKWSLDTAVFGRRAVRMINGDFHISIGTAIPNKELKSLGSDTEKLTYLRGRTYALAGNNETVRPGSVPVIKFPYQVTVKPGNPKVISKEVSQLSGRQRQGEVAGVEVFEAPLSEIPETGSEIGRLRAENDSRRLDTSGLGRIAEDADNTGTHFFGRDKVSGEIKWGVRVNQTPGTIELNHPFVVGESNPANVDVFWSALKKNLGSNPDTKVKAKFVLGDEYRDTSRQVLWNYFQSELSQVEYRVEASNFPTPLRHAEAQAIAKQFKKSENINAFLKDVEPSGKTLPFLANKLIDEKAKVVSAKLNPTTREIEVEFEIPASEFTD